MLRVLLLMGVATLTWAQEPLRPVVTWAEAQQTIIFDLKEYVPLHAPGGWNTTDEGFLPDAMLVELGIPLKYARAARDWPFIDEDALVSTQSSAHQYTIVGDVSSTDVYWHTQAFIDTYASPKAMVNALRIAAMNRNDPRDFPQDGSVIEWTDPDGTVKHGRWTMFGPQVW